MKDSQPDFLKLSSIEEDVLKGRLDAVRMSLKHSGEKGRALEGEVMSLLRSFLPNEYGLSTGFVAYHDDGNLRLSSQLDIIIYDQIRSGPIARLATCDVFPLESVYGYVEVKSSLQSSGAKKAAENSIERCIQVNKKLRSMTERRFWNPVKGSTIKSELVSREWLGLRSYIFAFEAQGTIAKNPDQFAKRIAAVSTQENKPVHLHGVFVAGSAYYETVPVDADTAKQDKINYDVKHTTKHALAEFKWSLLHSLSRFPRYQQEWTPAIDQYRGTSNFGVAE